MSGVDLSIIVPVYNAASYLPKTLDSILKQNFQNYELILVNDGSTDESGDICKRYAEMDDRIKVIHQSNGGVASARNTGLDHVHGKYIGFVDSDDLISPVMYETMLEIAWKYETDIVQCSHTRNPDVLCKHLQWEIIQPEILNNIDSLKRIYRSHYTNSLSLWSKVYKRELFSNIRFTEGTAFEDDEVVPLLLEKSEKSVFFEIPLYCYVRRENSIITAPKVKNIVALTNHLEHRMLRFKTIDAELYALGVKSLFYYLKGKATEVAFRDTEVQEQAVTLLRKYRNSFWKIGNKYDKANLILLSIPRVEKWVIHNDWEPIQNVLRKIRKMKYD